MDHAYQHDMGSDMLNRENLERSAVNFGNYIRSVYDEGPMRKGKIKKISIIGYRSMLRILFAFSGRFQ